MTVLTVLTVLFFIVASLYSLVGFGGGSSYIALLVFFEENYLLIPVIALICNLIVVCGGCFHFNRFGHLTLSRALPYVLTSVPFSFLGGAVKIDRQTFMLVLGLSLLAAGIRLLVFPSQHLSTLETRQSKKHISYLIGAFLGLLSGMIGIGGGIFLAPLLLSFRLARPKEVAAICSLFILVNSAAGLGGQFVKSSVDFGEVFGYSPLFLAVFVGGQVGSRISSSQTISDFTVKKLTAFLIIFVSLRLLFVM